MKAGCHINHAVTAFPAHTWPCSSEKHGECKDQHVLVLVHMHIFLLTQRHAKSNTIIFLPLADPAVDALFSMQDL